MCSITELPRPFCSTACASDRGLAIPHGTHKGRLTADIGRCDESRLLPHDRPLVCSVASADEISTDREARTCCWCVHPVNPNLRASLPLQPSLSRATAGTPLTSTLVGPVPCCHPLSTEGGVAVVGRGPHIRSGGTSDARTDQNETS